MFWDININIYIHLILFKKEVQVFHTVSSHMWYARMCFHASHTSSSSFCPKITSFREQFWCFKPLLLGVKWNLLCHSKSKTLLTSSFITETPEMRTWLLAHPALIAAPLISHPNNRALGVRSMSFLSWSMPMTSGRRVPVRPSSSMLLSVRQSLTTRSGPWCSYQPWNERLMCVETRGLSSAPTMAVYFGALYTQYHFVCVSWE